MAPKLTSAALLLSGAYISLYISTSAHDLILRHILAIIAQAHAAPAAAELTTIMGESPPDTAIAAHHHTPLHSRGQRERRDDLREESRVYRYGILDSISLLRGQWLGPKLGTYGREGWLTV
ncbi:hypothetical protein BDV98DRAFT_575137 [Pterulicium gracile]|uniref:Uncharacterized protein n=1 Tax=Pterulicium gracile TaxID=1884261 RepID=A0A5C3QFG4_9AGAR|nr:hypothetical protein BDV98DRAFT_575137 [Pterula gracilis]